MNYGPQSPPSSWLPQSGPNPYGQPAYYAPPPDNTPSTLVFVGAIIAAVFLGISALYILFVILMMGAFGAAFPMPGMGSLMGFMMTFILISVALQVVGVILAFQARSMIQRGQARDGFTRAIVAGALLLLTSTIPGVLILIGGIMGRGRTTPA